MHQDEQVTRLTLFAPRGRMGRAITAVVDEDARFVLDPDNGEVLIDFSVPAALPGSIGRAQQQKLPLLVGTTGLDVAAHDWLVEASAELAVLHASNTSLGANLLAQLVEQAAAVLDSGWDIEVVEMHHRMKADAPSGTALELGAAAARGRGVELGEHREGAREGVGLSRRPGGIGFASLRGGTVAGDHAVIFAGPDERLILSHRAENRTIFARGALAAARFLKGKPPGLYTMSDVIADLIARRP